MIFSVIMPVYNKAPYLEKALRSVLSQKHLKELIAVNDGSTDESGLILERIAKQDSRLIVINQENKGVSSARNAGIEKVSGNYVCFCDADDVLHCDFFEKAYNDIIDHSPDIAFFAFESISPDKSTELVNSPYEGITTKKEALNILYPYQIKTGYFGLVTNKLTKKDIIKQCLFNNKLKLAEDWDFWVSVMSKAELCLFSGVHSFSYNKALPGSSYFNDVDYISQLFLRIRYKELLNNNVPELDTKQLDDNIANYVYFSAAAACLKGIKNAKNSLDIIFKSDYKRKHITLNNKPAFHKLCLLFVKHKLDVIALTLIRAKQLIKGQNNV